MEFTYMAAFKHSYVIRHVHTGNWWIIGLQSEIPGKAQVIS